MQRIKRFKFPTKNWKMFYQFFGLGLLTAAFIGYSIAVWVAAIVVILSTIAGFFVNDQHHESKLKAAEQAYHIYLIEFESDDLIKGTTSTLLDKKSKELIREFLKEYRSTDYSRSKDS